VPLRVRTQALVAPTLNMKGRGQRLATALAALACLAGGAAFAAPPAMASTAWWHLSTNVWPANIAPGGEGIVTVRALNVGDQTASGPVQLEDLLPEHLKIQHVGLFAFSKALQQDVGSELCSTSGQHVSCSTALPAGAYEAHIQKLLEESGLTVPPLTQEEYEEIKKLFEEFISPRSVFEEENGIEPPRPYENIELQITVKDEGATPGASNTAQVSGGGGSTVTQRHAIPISSSPAGFGAEEFSMVPEEEGGGVDVQAGSHPYQLTTEFSLNQTADPEHPPALPRNLKFNLPAGLIGNATLVPQCSDLDFKHVIGGEENLCPAETVLGVASITFFEPQNLKLVTFPVPLFNLVPATGEPARFGFEIASSPVSLDASVRTGSDYGVSVNVSNITQLTNFISNTVTFWGVPGDKTHDSARGWSCLVGGHWTESGRRLPCVGSGQSHPAPFLTMPSSCKLPFLASVEGVSWNAPPVKPEASTLALKNYSLADEFGRQLGISGCNQLPFAPAIDAQPDVTAASTPTGLTTTVKVPQEVSLGANGLASSSVRDISVKFPEGVTVNPAGADGLEACSEEQVGFTGFGELDPSGEPGALTALFTPTIGSPFCPTASKIGTVKIKIPVIADPLEGALYLARQDANPFHTLLASYIVAKDEESGILVKLPGKITLDQQTGQLTATFENSPDAPLESAEIHLFGGDRAPLSTPSQCRDNTPEHPGVYTTVATFTPWSGTAPVTSSSDFEIKTGPNGGPCPPPALPFAPTLAAGSPNISAGSFSPLVTTISRADGNQNIDKVQLHLAPGLSGILAGVPLCHEAEANAGTCPEASLIGHTIVSVGLGGDPFSVTGGKVYLTEKYEGAPFGLSIVNPAVAGPFDLGKVIVRAKIEVDPLTAALTVTTGEIPHILDGIPLQIKHVNVTIDRQGFTFNPTNCNPLAITGSIGAFEGATAPVSDAFQVTNCAALKFAPKFSVSTNAKTSKANGASLSVKLTYPSAPFGTYANVAKVKVSLPKQLPSRLTTLQKACTAQAFAQNPESCPQASRVGHAKVITPLLPVPLEGPAYFVSHGGEAFPDLTIVLKGSGAYPITVELVGSTQIKNGVTTSTFKATPDTPFSSFELTLPEGPTSALAANANLCASKLTMPTEFTAQNGALLKRSTPIRVTGCKKGPNRLKQALKACHKKHSHAKRKTCERAARRRFGGRK
jgi:hypothetical protein